LIEIFDCWSTCSYGRLWVITSYFYGGKNTLFLWA
jgi:hypothetical protein